jgi:hypothetical protein
MGMAGHLVIVRHDLSVFAHVHPAGSVPMAALMLLQKSALVPHAGATGSTATGQPVASASDPANRVSDALAGMHHDSSLGTAVGNELSFPYGFPQPGNYRLFLQIKRAGTVGTAVFDARVTQ